MTTVVEQDPVLAEVFRSTVGSSVTIVPSLEHVEKHLGDHPAELVVVLGPSVGHDAAAAFAGRHRILRPTLAVILVRPTVDHGVLTDALRSGMSEVVETSDAPGLREAVRRAHEVARAVAESLDLPGAVTTGSLVTVFSTKGGVGKSLVATNVAAGLADLGRRVCLVDLDVHCGDVAIMLQLTPAHSLADLAQLVGDIDASGVESLLTRHSEHLCVLAAPVQLGAPVPSEPVGRLLATLKGMFDVVVVDTSGMFDDFVLHALDHTDSLVLVGTLDIPSLKSLKLAAGTLDLLNIPRERWRLVLNRADAKVGLSPDEFEDTLGLKATISIASSRDVLMAVNRGEPIVLLNRGHQASKALASLASSLDQDPAVPPAPVALESKHASRRASRRGLRTRKVS